MLFRSVYSACKTNGRSILMHGDKEDREYDDVVFPIDPNLAKINDQIVYIAKNNDKE